jgi:hypothetical protein
MSEATRLRESIRKLRAELDALDRGDQEAGRRLGELVRDLEAALEDPRRGADRTGLGEQLKVSMLKLEASHPRLAGVMNEVVESLASMGI